MRSIVKLGFAVLATATMTLPALAQSAPRWQGFYMGALGSYVSSGTSYPSPNTPPQSLSGAMLGGQIGYSLQSGSLVYGLEADISFGKLNDFIRDGNYLTESGKISQLGTVRARLGYDMGGWMPYITGGLMWDTLQQNTTCPAGAGFGVCALTGPFSATVTKTFTGFTAGPGAELAISDKWSLKGDILFSNLGKQTYTSTIPVAGTISAQVGQTLHSVSRLGISYKF